MFSSSPRGRRVIVWVAFAICAAAAIALMPVSALAVTWNVEFAPSPAITTSIDRGMVKMRTRVSVIRLTAPVLRSEFAGAGDYWESRVECEGVGFDDFVDAHFSYRTRGVVRVPASRVVGGPGRDFRAVALYFHGGYGPPSFWKSINYFPDVEREGDTLVGVPALTRGLAYVAFNMTGWDEEGKFTARMLERAGLARPEDPPELVHPSGRLVAFSAVPLRKGDVVPLQTASVARDLIRAAKQAVIVVAGAAGLNGGNLEVPDDLPALIHGHSFGGYLTSAVVLGVNPLRPGVASGGNRLDPANPSSPAIVAGAIPMAPAIEFLRSADPNAPLIPMIFINGETDPLFGPHFAVAARYGELLAGRGLGLRDRVSLWSLGNTSHSPPEVNEFFEVAFGSRRGGDRWSPFVDAALGHLLRIVFGEGDRRMPASHYDGRREDDRIVFPQMGAPPTDLVPFVIDPRRDVFDDPFVSPAPLPSWAVDAFTAVAQELEPTGHLVGPRMANPIGGYRFNFDGAELIAPFEDLGLRYGSWKAYLDRSKSTVDALERAGVYVAPREKAALVQLLDPAAFEAFAAQGLAASGP